MNILLWILQVIIAVYCIMGSFWRFWNYEKAVNEITSMNALPAWGWNAIGVFEVICALGLVLPGAFSMKPRLTSIAAIGLTIEMFLLTALHAYFFGPRVQATNPAVWTFMLCALSAFVAYGRTKLRPM